MSRRFKMSRRSSNRSFRRGNMTHRKNKTVGSVLRRGGARI